MTSDPVRNLVSDHQFRSAYSAWLAEIKAAHTIVWAFFVACVLEIPSLRGAVNITSLGGGRPSWPERFSCWPSTAGAAR